VRFRSLLSQASRDLSSTPPVPPRAIALQVGERAVQDKAVLIRTAWDEHWGTEAYRKAAP
jgi:hypothetical protein